MRKPNRSACSGPELALGAYNAGPLSLCVCVHSRAQEIFPRKRDGLLRHPCLRHGINAALPEFIPSGGPELKFSCSRTNSTLIMAVTAQFAILHRMNDRTRSKAAVLLAAVGGGSVGRLRFAPVPAFAPRSSNSCAGFGLLPSIGRTNGVAGIWQNFSVHLFTPQAAPAGAVCSLPSSP